MVERRWHKKSRNGCDQCKQRRVKCDETLPICKGCIRRQSQCSYAEAPPAQGSSVSPSQETVSDAGGPANHIPSCSTELQLMHHFLMHTSTTMVSKDMPGAFWQERLPLLATQNDFLLYAILSVASIHISIIRPHEAEQYLPLAMSYRDRTLKILPTVFSAPNVDHAEAVFWSSALVGVITMASHMTMARSGSSLRTLLYELWGMWKGSETISAIFVPILGHGIADQVNPLVSAPMSPVTPTPSPGSLESKLMQLRKMFAEELTDMPELLASSLPAFDVLLKAWHRFQDTGSGDGLIAWFPDQDKVFMGAFRANNVHATLLIILWGVVMHGMRDVWYVHDLGAKLVHELTPFIPLEDKEKVALTNWAREQVCG